MFSLLLVFFSEQKRGRWWGSNPPCDSFRVLVMTPYPSWKSPNRLAASCGPLTHQSQNTVHKVDHISRPGCCPPVRGGKSTKRRANLIRPKPQSFPGVRASARARLSGPSKSQPGCRTPGRASNGRLFWLLRSLADVSAFYGATRKPSRLSGHVRASLAQPLRQVLRPQVLVLVGRR